jgi:enediyne polyketide synthase
MTPAIAIVGMACRYPDARSPAELWENALAKRRAFRRIPPERLSAEDYYSPDRDAPDRTYCLKAALIENYEFDRARFNISGSTYRTTDLAHWLALDIADQALADAGLGETLPRESTAVYVGNTLTGEFSRANTLRLRWPYTRRVMAAALAAEGWEPARLDRFLDSLEQSYKRPFPPVGEDTLAGGLSNTIAGRVSNYFDLKGGGYTVDGACASSLLAVTTACSALAAGDIQVALAGGVDLSIDPFELVGFAKSRALAGEEMRVFDARANGFWPGEGCGFVVLMRQADALARHCRIYAVIRGWGVSSDGSGGISRPEPEGQLLAIRRAYCRAGFAASTAAYVEGHGTGTTVGDTTELQALTRARREADPTAPPAALGSIKANIGHTKAAAGVAGLIKAAMAVDSQILPPATACETPHEELMDNAPALRVLPKGESWPAGLPLRASASAMGFGGINTHVVLEGAAAARRELTAREQALLSSAQDAELFLFTSEDRIADLAAIAARLSRAELTDAAADLAAVPVRGTMRAAVMASTPEELADRLARLSARVQAGQTTLNPHDGVFAGMPASPPRIGFLFPGQGSLPPQDRVQPAIVKASLAALGELRRLSLDASVAIGHSLGELTALCWGGALDEEAAIDIAAARDRIMAGLAGPPGAMAGIALSAAEVTALIGDEPVAVAALNTPRQTVISGEAAVIARIIARARERGIAAVALPVSHAFHSRLMQPAAAPLAEYLSGVSFAPLQRKVVSTITGAALPNADLRDLLRKQLTSPVRFADAVAAVGGDVDLWIEVGPGAVLSGMLGERAIPMDAGGRSVKGLLSAFAAAFVLGAPVDCGALFAARLTRPFTGLPKFFCSPCEFAPTGAPVELRAAEIRREQMPPLELVRQLVAERTELPLSAIQPGQRLLSDLHLNSITVAQLVAEAARRCGVPPPVSALRFADGTLSEVARMLETAPAAAPAEQTPTGVDSWIRTFTVDLRPAPLDKRQAGQRGGGSIPAAPLPWQPFIPPGYPLAGVADLPSTGGVLLCLPPSPDETHVPLMLAAARAALACQAPAQFLLVQQGGGGAAFARTLHLEAPGLTTCVVDLPLDHPRAAEWIAAEAHAAAGYCEAHYDAEGRRYEPALELLEPEDQTSAELGSADVLLVTGGGKGIAAECALALARGRGVRLALLGRSDPALDGALAANLERMRAAGAQLRYVAADVTNPAAMAAAFHEIETSLGPVTGILHGAGNNQPCLLAGLDEAAFLGALAPKLQGLRNVLRAADPGRLRLLAAFGSIIARTGLEGEAHYAVANEWMARAVDGWRAEHPHCRCLTIDWSVWSGLGMGQRLGRIEELTRRGITPITPEEGARIFSSLPARASHHSSIIVTGRYGDPPTLRHRSAELPFARFLERPRVHYPGVELIADAELSTHSDPYLLDHVFQGVPLLPAVMGLEAMAQVAGALCGANQPPVFAGVRFSRPVHIPDGTPVTVRLAALARSRGVVDVVLRSSETAFQVDHFRATCRFESSGLPQAAQPAVTAAPSLQIDPARDLYGAILFQSGRFRRLRAYRRLRATGCVAEIAAESAGDWFARYLPATLALGDPGARDAFIHSVQACIPHATVLPVGVERIAIAAQHPGPRFVEARERSAHDGLLTYDLDVTDPDGTTVERWEGLQLQVIGTAPRKIPWIAPLLGPYLERKIREMAPGARIAIAMGRNGSSQHAIEQALGFQAALSRRPDGKPEVNGHCVSASRAGDLVGAVAGATAAGCDLESVIARPPAVWRDLLGAAPFALAELIARESEDDAGTAATRVWCALECLKKAGAPQDQPLMLSATRPDRWIELAAGQARILTYRFAMRDMENPLAFAVMLEPLPVTLPA